MDCSVTPQFYRIEDIIGILHISKNFAYELVRSKQIPSIKLGKVYRIPVVDFNQWVSQNSTKY